MPSKILLRIFLTNVSSQLAVFLYTAASNWLIRLNDRRRVEKVMAGKALSSVEWAKFPYKFHSLDKDLSGPKSGEVGVENDIDKT